MRTWVFLLYRLPTEPSARRVHVWRKLKRLGAILLHDSVWILPAMPTTIEQFQWLAQEIVELEGSASVWQATSSLAGQDEALVRQFTLQTEADYQLVRRALERAEADLPALTRRYRQLQRQDYFHVALGEQVRRELEQARGKQR